MTFVSLIPAFLKNIAIPARRTLLLLQDRLHFSRALLFAAILFALLGAAQRSAAQNTIYVNSTVQGNSNGLCSLQEAIYSAEFGSNIAIGSTDPDATYTTGCVAGSGKGDTIVLPNAVFQFNTFWDGDAHNPFGPTATPIIFKTMTIQGNGATLQWTGTGNSPSFRLFAVGYASLTVNGTTYSGTGNLTLQHVYIKGFHVKGGDSLCGGGGGLGAGGAIYVGTVSGDVPILTVQNSTFDGNGANGGSSLFLLPNSCVAGGGGGLGGNGGTTETGGGGGGGARGDGGAGTIAGGGGGGTVFGGGPGENLVGGTGGAGGYLCGGNGGDDNNSGHDATCPGGGGGGAGGDAEVLGNNGGIGAYGGGGGGGGFAILCSAPDIPRGGSGGAGGFGGGGGAASGDGDDNGGNGGFGAGGGGAISGCPDSGTPGKGGAFGGDGTATSFANVDFGEGGGGGALGGAIFNDSGNVTIQNSTFYNNFVAHGIGVNNGADSGGAIFSRNGSLTVQNVTISGNQATGSGGGIEVYNDGASTIFVLDNTIIANNGDQECITYGTVTTSNGGTDSAANLVMKNSGCPAATVTSDPQLGPLQLNSPGDTPTMAIQYGASSAVDAGDDKTALATDQRGVARPQGPRSDIGAYEAIKPSADLSISKATVGEPYAGRYFSWIIDVENQGPTDAQNVSITDTLPVGVTFSSITGSGGFSCGGTGTVTCTKATMTAGEIDSLTLTVFIPANVAGGTQITNTASITSTTADPNPADNSASVSATVNTLTDLSIAKVGPSAPVAGTDVTYTITVANLGPSDAQTVVLSDNVVAGTSFVSLTAPSGWNCVKPAPGTAGPAPLTCGKSTFPAGGTASFALVVHLGPSAAQNAQLCDAASISAVTSDPDSSNNSSQSCGTVQTSADLALTQTVTTSGTAGNGSATFNLGLKNNGPSDSQNISLVASSSVFSNHPSTVKASGGGTCAVVGKNVTCTWATLPLLAADTVAITVSWHSAVGQVCDAATLSAGTPDPNATNNSSTMCTAKK